MSARGHGDKVAAILLWVALLQGVQGLFISKWAPGPGASANGAKAGGVTPLFNRGMRLCWNGKYGGSGPTSVWDIEHGARPPRTPRGMPGGDMTGLAACQGSSL